ncbi:MAG: hypothetical protein ACE5GE_16835 [Phycisphaerae bacterium]
MANRIRRTLCVVALLVAVGSVVPVLAGDEKASEALCPVMGEPVDFSVSMATDEGPVFVCCKGCIKKMKKNPDKYADAIAAQRKALAGRDKVQVTCPISGKPIDKDAFAEVNGKKIYMCCPKCVDKYKANPDKFAGKLAASYTYQTKCPLSGEKIDTTAFATLPSGLKIYTCCSKCSDKFQADPEKYWSSLEKQGFNVSLKGAMKAG